jgi:nucleotidyltransferase/DNA polymerase involved in DNA repair
MEANPEQRKPMAATDLLQTTRRRGNVFLAIAALVVAGFALVILLGVAGIGTLGLFSLDAAMTMIGLAIVVLGATQFATLLSLRRTLSTIAIHQVQLAVQAERQAETATQVTTATAREQRIRDRMQDRRIAGIADRREAERQALDEKIERVATAANVSVPQGPVPEPFGQVHPIRDIEPIGDRVAKELEEIGIRDTAELWRASPHYVAGRLGVPTSRVVGWQQMSELMAVSGIGTKHAELLVRAGVPSVRRLAQLDPSWLAARLERVESSKDSKTSRVTTKVAENWVNAAKETLVESPTDTPL